MTLNDRLLRKLASWRLDRGRETLTLDAPDAGWKVDLVADCVETVGARLWEIALTRTAPVADPAPLAEEAGRITSRVTGLMEPLRLVEVDAARGVAQLRSTAPAARGEDVLYYEVLRHAGGDTTVRRYQAHPATGKREQVAFTLTLEALAKLVTDLAG